MLNHQRELTLSRLTAAHTATSSAYLLTLQFLWRQAILVRNGDGDEATGHLITAIPLFVQASEPYRGTRRHILVIIKHIIVTAAVPRF